MSDKVDPNTCPHKLVMKPGRYECEDCGEQFIPLSWIVDATKLPEYMKELLKKDNANP